MENKVNLLKSGILMALASTGIANAAPQMTGTPDAKPALVETVGLDVDGATAIKTIVPEGWGVLVHKSSQLPSKLSWREGKDWVTTLDSLLEPHRMNIKIDWNKKTVFLKKMPEEMVQPDLSITGGSITSAANSLVLEKGERLSTSLTKFLKVHGYNLKMDLSDNQDFEFDEKSVFSGANMKDILDKAMPRLGLEAEIYKPSKIVVIKYRDEVAQ